MSFRRTPRARTPTPRKKPSATLGGGSHKSQVRSQRSDLSGDMSVVRHCQIELNIICRRPQVRKENKLRMSATGSVRIDSAKDLRVYNLGYELAMDIFEATKKFPSEEKYALTSQIRRSSRSICLNLREAWAKRRYEAHFVSKLTDCDGENSETDSALDFAKDCRYISADQHKVLTSRCEEIGRMLNGMIKKATSFVTSSSDI
jgi:four helix bundle protein